jgi:hypothetical protein
MNTEKQSIITKMLSSTNTIDRTEIVDEVSRSKDKELIIAMLDAFNELNAGEKGNALAVSAVGLFDTLPSSLDALLYCLQSSMEVQTISSAAYLLGEISYKQGKNRDARIIPALIQGLQQTMPMGAESSGSYIYGIRECARSGAVKEAESVVISFLVAADQPHYHFSCFYLIMALEILAINAKDDESNFESELPKQLARLSPTSYAYRELFDWLEEQEKSQ